MEFGLFLPPGEGPHPVLYYLSGLTCNWENATTKAGFQQLAAELGIAVVTPDTSPRGDATADDSDRWDLGTGAGFYVDATAEPWSAHYNMYSYVTAELPALLDSDFPVDVARASVTGHSMGGHGALVIGLRNPEAYRSVSAFSPIVAPSQVQWGEDAFGAYLADESEWAAYDATELVSRGRRPGTILIEQGLADGFLEPQLRTHLFRKACEKSGQPVAVNMREGYDHSYYFIASFIDDHLRFHAEALR
jgi:S-formylglutathione hydrolase